MSAGKYNILCEQGATFSQVITWTDSEDVAIDLTDYTAKMQVRRSEASPNSSLELSTENGGISLNSSGEVSLTISSADTADISSGQYVYDLEMTTGETTTRLIQGTFTVSAEVTK